MTALRPMCQIAHICTDFSEKFGIPRQSGMVDELQGRIIFEPEFRNPDALRGLEGFSHIWVLWEFSANIREAEAWSPTVRPPRLGGDTRKGVFATRSPFRPNPVGLSCVRIEKIHLYTAEGPVIDVRGVDMLNGTPVYDIKPYLPNVDSHPEAAGGFAAAFKDYALRVEIPREWIEKVPEEKREALTGILANDPRPSYQEDAERIYGLSFAGMNIRFTVSEGCLTVCGVTLTVEKALD